MDADGVNEAGLVARKLAGDVLLTGLVDEAASFGGAVQASELDLSLFGVFGVGSLGALADSLQGEADLVVVLGDESHLFRGF